MAEQDEDDSQKTEEPSQRKLEESAKKGDIPQSQELKHWMVLTAAALAAVIAAGPTVETIREELAGFMAHAHQIPLEGQGFLEVIRSAGGEILLALLMPLGIIFLGGLAGNLVQHKPIFTTEKIKPKPDKISPIKGFKRLFSAHRLMEFAKTIAKFVVVGAILLMLLWPETASISMMVQLPVSDLTQRIFDLALLALFGVISAMAVVAAIDVAFQQQQHHKKMRMTKQEVKDEHKQMEGDPQVKAKLREIRLERGRKRMMAKVPEADVVITNPTHYAVALEYKHGQTTVPVVLAKGIDQVALRIRALAEDHDIPIVENRPLAQTLYASVEVDEEIPAEHYQAVARVISYVLRLRKQGRGRSDSSRG